jgi:O-antigen ligase
MSMDMQSSITPGSRTIMTAPELLAVHKRRNVYLFIVIFIIMFSLTPLLVLTGVTFGIGLVLGGFVSLIVATLIVRWPLVGFFMVAACAVLVEQYSVLAPILTDHLYIFYWPPALEGLIERPIGFLFILILLTVACRRLVSRRQPLQGGELLLPFLFYLLCVAGGILHGLTSGGDLKITVVEVRPFWYLFVSYLVAYNLVASKRHIHLFFWIVILSAGVKALQGLYIYLIVLHGNLTGHREVLSHEESFFFVALFILLILFCLYHSYRPQLRMALVVLPFVLIALIANQRRADYLALLVGMAVTWAFIFCLKPRIRGRLVALTFICIVLGTSYIATFSNSTAGFAQPAHAIVSIFQPDPQLAPSNMYRAIEDYDLKYTVKQDPLLGFGFGKKFLQPIHLHDISAKDQNYLYIPHNTIYWVWMRLGTIGFFALWYLFGVIIIRGCIIARRLRDPYLQLTAIYIVAVTFMEIVVAYADYQLFDFRNVIYLGLLVGILMKLPALDEHERKRACT